MKISYAITVCNEFEEIQKLVNFLLLNKREEDEIIILFDYNNGTTEVLDFLREKSVGEKIIFYKERFNNHFADWKNQLTEYCSGDYIFQIDADEIPHKLLMINLPTILENNPDHEVYLVPRVNTVEGLTESHIKKWGWQVNDKGWVNYPDYQYRIWKNKPEIKWKNKVHEVLEGHKNFTSLPSQEELSLYHPKTIERQEKQNEYYNTL
jgi:GT2 family glycosyltransferase